MQGSRLRLQKALVTGGAGFIGSNLVRELVARGTAVTVLDNLVSGYADNLQGLSGVRLIRGDVRDPLDVAEAMRGSDAVFHLAASVGNGRSIERPVEDASTNVMGTLQVLEACRVHRVRKLVFSSSASVYGEQRTIPIREDHPVEPDSPYGAAKLGAEKACLAYAKVHGIEAMCLRLFNVYGPGQRFDAYGNVIPIFVSRMLRGDALTVFGDGKQTRDFVHIDDVVQAHIRAAEARRVWGAFNVGSGTRTSINGLATMLGRTFGRNARIDHAPPRRGEVRDSLADVSAARATFGYDPRIPFSNGLEDYVAWSQADLQLAAA